MSQLALFDLSAPLLDSARGKVTYQANFVASDEAAHWFEILREGIAWKAGRRRMYEREVDVPRVTAHFRLDSSGRADASAPAAVAGVLGTAAARVRAAVGAPFNSVGVNHYRDGNDSVAPHHDTLHDLVVGEPIALLSLGATRRMAIRAQARGSAERAIAIDLVAGSLLVMSYSSQLHYLHGIAKTRAPVGPRISLALRVRPD
ncbi:MAG TPA: alpha-ketoglutarate-dependent dioxygenase AlkB [Dokdonella sp.]